MIKTIEEAVKEAVRKEYLCEKCAWKENCDFCGGENTAFDCCECPADSYEDGFKAGAKYILEQPLRDRLTAEEKERVRKMYNDEAEFFGAEMFDEKRNNMEIKVGDKVRVRDDAPKILRKTISSKVFEEESEVIAKDDELAVIWTESIHKNLIPLKYLIKAENDAKEPKFRVGDKVAINCAYENGEIWDKVMHGRVDTIKSICRNAESSLRVYGFVEGFRDFAEGRLEPYTEPTEDEMESIAPESVKNPRKDGEESQLCDSSQENDKWEQYTADLAKEIALKVANKYNDPKEVADYAISVAKAVVEELKKK